MIIREEQNENGLRAFTELPENVTLDSTALGMLSNSPIPGMIPLNYLQLNGEKKLYYEVGKCYAASAYLSGTMTKQVLLPILEGVAAAFVAAEEYMMIPECLILDWDRVYVNRETGETRMLYMPVLEAPAQDSLKLFLQKTLPRLNYSMSEGTDYAVALNTLVNSEAFSAESLKKEIDRMKRERIESMAQSSGSSAFAAAGPAASVQNPAKAGVPYTAQKKTEKDGYEIPKEPEAVVISKKTGLSERILRKNKKEETEETEKKVRKSLLGKLFQEDDEEEDSAVGSAGFDIPGMESRPKAIHEGQKPAAAGKPGQQEPRPVRPEIPKSPEVPRSPEVPAAGNPGPRYSPAPVRSDRFEAQIPGSKFGSTVVLDFRESNLSAPQNVVQASGAYLKRIRTGERILINKGLFAIGRKPQETDYCIEGNKAIGRKHAYISISNSGSAITDLGSVNHSYVNGQRLEANKPYPLKNGDEIRLADVDFEFLIV